MRYVFLELPKYPGATDPRTAVDKWAYFFRETARLREVPPVLAEAPFARALQITRTSSFTEEEWEAYDRAKIAEQDARGALSLERKLGRAAGKAEGLIAAIVDLCAVLDLELTDHRRGWIAGLDEPGLRDLIDRIKRTRRWP